MKIIPNVALLVKASCENRKEHRWSKKASSEIINDIYGTRVEKFYEYELAESINPDNIKVKLETLKDTWFGLYCVQISSLTRTT